MIGLNDYLSRNLASAAPPGDLCEQLEGSLPGAEIREVQRGIGGEDSDQAHFREIQPLAHHLSPQKEIGFTLSKSLQDGLMGAFPPGSVKIHAQQA